MTREEYELNKKIRAVEGKILARLCENYSMKIQAAIDELIKERDSVANCHYQMYQKSYDAINRYENELLDTQIKIEIEELVRC